MIKITMCYVYLSAMLKVNTQGMKRKRLELANLKTLRSPFPLTFKIAEIGDKLVLKIIT
jgi:hypothetical protein